MTKKTNARRNRHYEFSQNGITIPEFTWKYLNLNAIESFLYGLMFSYGTVNYTLEQYCKLTGVGSEQTIQKYLDKLVNEDLIRKKVVYIMTNRKRTIYTNCYDRNGRISDTIIEQKLEDSAEKLKLYYEHINPIRMKELRKRKENKRK